MPWSDAGRRSAIVLVALTVAISVASREPSAAVREIRPAVTLVLRIDTGNIRDKMGDDDCTGSCETLRASLVDSVRALLALRYPFLRWQSEAAADTIELA